MPLTVGNEYQGKTTKLYYQVEAFQGNTEMDEQDTNTYCIYSVYNLASLEYKISNYDNVLLMNDIDMSNVQYTPFDVVVGTYLIGYAERAYSWVNQKIVNREVPDCQISGNGNTDALMSLSNYEVTIEGAEILNNSINGMDWPDLKMFRLSVM